VAFVVKMLDGCATSTTHRGTPEDARIPARVAPSTYVVIAGDYT
jgi:hypothetical protein